MPLPNDYARCADIGPACPSAKVCQRRTDKGDPTRLNQAALPYTREAGSSACPSFIRVGVDVLALSIHDGTAP